MERLEFRHKTEVQENGTIKVVIMVSGLVNHQWIGYGVSRFEALNDAKNKMLNLKSKANESKIKGTLN